MYKNEAVLTDTAMEIRNPFWLPIVTSTLLHFSISHTVPCTNKLSAGTYILGKPKGDSHANI